MLLFEFFPMFITVLITVAAIVLFVMNRRHPYDPAEAEARRGRAAERRARAEHEPPKRGGGRRPSMSA